MFFLGEFNSIIPYVLYLSLIWVFMAIGFHGKIIEVWHKITPREYHVENVTNHQPAYDIVKLNQKVSNHKQNKTDGYIHTEEYSLPPVLIVGTIFPGNFNPNIFSRLNLFNFRGPPSFFF
jgi:hypothetical protein